MAESTKGKMIGFWILTAIVGLSQMASGVADLAGAAPVLEGVTKLGYPAYILNILGPAKLAGGLTILAPRMPRLKEWAYAGFVFDFGGAFLSHLFHGDGPPELAPPLVLLALLMGSYALRPADRRLG